MFGFPSDVFGFGSLHSKNRFGSQAEKFRERDSNQEPCDLVIFASDRILVDSEPIINRAHEATAHARTTRQDAVKSFAGPGTGWPRFSRHRVPPITRASKEVILRRRRYRLSIPHSPDDKPILSALATIPG